MQHGDLVVTDINENIIFKLKDSKHSLYSTRVLLDAAENPITLKPKHFSMHNRWQVFKGESTESSDLLFTAKRSSISMFQWKTKLDVFLANNSEQKVCDFKVKGSWSDHTPCVFYAGEFSSVIAQMHKKMEVESVLKGKKTVMVTVFPNQDYGFIVALMVILTAIKEHSQDDGDAGGDGGVDAGGGDGGAGCGGGGGGGGGCGGSGGCGGG
ncbi:hypothetical protein SLE2022_315000 [Rubroshorea leprosula]